MFKNLFAGKKDINHYVSLFKEDPSSAYLLDVRADDEYEDKHIPGSIHIPLSGLAEAEYDMPDKEKTVYVYCKSGQRAGHAVTMLQVMGYENAVNIGGIDAYKGETE